MSEKYNFSEDKTGDIFRQLPHEEKEAVIGAAQEEMADIHKKASELAGEGEKPTSRHYQNASEQIDSEKEKSESILTPEQESGVIKIIKIIESGSWGFNNILPKEIIEKSDKIKQAAKKAMIIALNNGNVASGINTADQIRNSTYAPKEILASEEVRQAAKEALMKILRKGQVDSACQARNLFSSEEVKEIILSEDVQLAALEGLSSETASYSNFAEIISKDFLAKAPWEIIEKLHDVQKLLKELQKLSPEFYEQAHKSLNILIPLIRFRKNQEQFLRMVKENLFLLNAISENPRFGSKLLIKYPKFDELSKENIETLFDAKKEILANNPDTDPASLEFRQLMQEKLKEYKNNPDILKVIQESGINIDEWLNYSETQYFNLESGDSHLMFSETIQTPLNRIKETLDSYARILKSVLKEYKSEMEKYEIILENTDSTKEQIIKMEAALEQARAKGDEKKAQDIERGLVSQKEKLNNPKKGFLWNKLMGDIDAFQNLKNDVFGAQEKLTQAENDLQEKLSGKLPSGKMIQELKEKINKAKEELRGKFSVLETRVENFKTNLLPLIAPALGEERSEALIQEIEQNLAEQFDHWSTDRRDLANLFSERGDREKGRLENQPMSIFVWARNPDIDLYQGNYSPCCICIDSAHMGAESTIADYNTDLGIQIVNIYDETKNEPVTAAWCWLGASENGETVLVVDNIESNTMYSANYSEQLTKELFDYLENYAKAIGAKKIVLGKANNDLPTAGELAKMPESDEQYDKIGGYNRVDGYFLEAENKSVKVIWEEKELKEEAAGKKTEQEKKAKFLGLNIKNLTENDFSKIKQLERKIYAGTGLIAGQEMIDNINNGNGLEHSVIQTGKRASDKPEEIISYIVAYESETDEGDACVYLEDIAVILEAQRQGIGWNMLKSFVEKLKEKAKRE